MRFFEFNTPPVLDKFVMLLRNHIGRAKSKGASVELTWKAVGKIAQSSGFEFASDYETFKHIYDSNPGIQELVKNFNANGIVLDVPGVSSDQDKVDSDEETPQEKVDKIAAQAAPDQVSRDQATAQT